MICMLPGVAYSQVGDESLTVLGPGEARKVDKATARGLTWLAKEQEADGSFPTDDNAEPAITSLCLFAFLACGHLPGEGEYGESLEKGVDFVVSCQKGDGSIVQLPPPLKHVAGSPTQTGPYAHAISGLLLSEVYGMTSGDRAPICVKRSIGLWAIPVFCKHSRNKTVTIWEGGAICIPSMT